MGEALSGVAVVGSLNWDVMLRVDALPTPGDTRAASERFEVPGGKGANQARAAALLGSPTTMVGCVGSDAAGEAMLEALRGVGVDTGPVARVAGASGGAVVMVEASGENAIVIDAGANAALTPAHLDGAGLERAAVVLTNFEAPLETVAAVPAAAAGLCILNPAPAPSEPPSAELLDGFDLVVPNRGELAALAGVSVPSGLDEVAAAARRLPAATVVVTLGADGALICPAGDEPDHIPAAPARPVDTSGAGDAFCGALADGLARGLDPGPAAHRAAAAAAIVTEHHGAAAPASLAAELAIQGDFRDRSRPELI